MVPSFGCPRQQKFMAMNGAHLASPITGELGYSHRPQLGSQNHCLIGNQIWGPLGKKRSLEPAYSQALNPEQNRQAAGQIQKVRQAGRRFSPFYSFLATSSSS